MSRPPKQTSKATGEYITLHIERVEGDTSVRFGLTSAEGAGVPVSWFDSDQDIPKSAGQYERAVRAIWRALIEQDIHLYIDPENRRTDGP